MKSLMLFLQCVLKDLGTLCCTSTDLDLKKIQARVKHEGESFITITLPTFGKDLEVSPEKGMVTHDQFKGFAFTGGLPRFLGGFLEQVFDRGTGVLLNNPSSDAIFAVRQLTLMFAKIQSEASFESLLPGAFDGYIKIEEEVRESDDNRSDEQLASFYRMSKLLWDDLFLGLDHRLYDSYEAVIPRHSSGATADGLYGNAKYQTALWTTRMDDAGLHAVDYLVPSYNFWEEIESCVHLDPGAEQPVKVIAVPKTSTKLRIIAEEPSYVQFMQQGMLEAITEAVQGLTIPRKLVSWRSQVPNQDMARRGSLYGDLATLDLSDASDRVSNQLVTLMLRDYGTLAGMVSALRSEKADVPQYGIIPLAKYASMGSSLCFPIEALVFMTIVFIGIEDETGHRLRKKDIKSLLSQVRTYGDDIIVPVRFVRSVISSLEAYGLKVNKSKSFWNGKFRESCGKDYYAGDDVSIVRMRRYFPTSRKDVQELVGTVEFRNHLYKAGLWNSVRFLDQLLERIIPFPAVEETSPGLGKISFLGHQSDGWDDKLHRPFVKACVAVPKLPVSRLDNHGALLKFFLKRGDEPYQQKDHLIRAGRPVSVDIKYRKVSPF